MIQSGRHWFLISCRGIAITGLPRHTASFVRNNFCLLRLMCYALIFLWLVTLAAHINFALDGFSRTADWLGVSPAVLATIPIVVGIGAVSYLLVVGRGQMSIADAQRHGLICALGMVTCEGLQFGLTVRLEHIPSFALCNLIVFAIVPLRATQQVVLAALSSALPIVTAVLTGIPTARAKLMVAASTLPMGAVVLGLIAFYWQVGTMRARTLAELKLARQTAAVERQKNELERRRKLDQTRTLWLEQMAQFLRHELRNALAGATTSLTLLQRRSGIPDSDTYVARTKQALRVISTLLESVGEATSIESTLIREQREPVGLRQVVRDQVEVYRSIYPEKIFSFESDGEDSVIFGNAERCIEMLNNLVSNAIDYAEAGTPIILSCHCSDGRAVLKVINWGSTIANKQDIFAPFLSFREQATAGQHLGIGLYMVQLIARRYGGDVEARDLPLASGTEFRVTLPIHT